MTIYPVLIAGVWQQARNPVGSFTAKNPITGTSLDDDYPVSSFDDLALALEAAKKAATALRACSPEMIAQFLDTFAVNIEANCEALVEQAHLETALPKSPRLAEVELPRTTNQLRQAAAAVRDRSWCQATIDAQTNIRSKFSALNGPVVIFGPNNFPLAFNGVSGGDFATAIAAGNPVIAKAHPGHPGTSRILAEAAFEALQSSGLPASIVQLFYHTPPEDGLKLVAHPLTGAVAFTGSRQAGLRLKEAADKAGIPIYLEMSSINPVFILPHALKERSEQIAGEFTTSCLLGAGQFCTNPGLVILLDGPNTDTFLQQVVERFSTAPCGTLLSEHGPAQIAQGIELAQQYGAQVLVGGQPNVENEGYSFQNTLLKVSGSDFLAHPAALQNEIFGNVSLYVVADSPTQMEEIARRLEGNLTGTLYTHTEGQDDELYRQIEAIVRPKVGRLLNDKMPTGVVVSPAMVHGGPYPSTGHPGFTAVGIPASILRFAARHSYDNVRHHRLPPELQDRNPTGQMWRFIDGEWTRRDV
jgi:alpha-ketoglutaric semialdehyde dehydrogenase